MSTITRKRSPNQKKLDEVVLERVKRGMAWLEEQHGPDWVDHLDLKALDLRSGDACILGQVYGENSEGSGSENGGGYEFAIDKFSELYDLRDRDRMGFTVDSSRLEDEYGDYETAYEAAWDELEETWKHVLTPLVSRSK